MVHETLPDRTYCVSNHRRTDGHLLKSPSTSDTLKREAPSHSFIDQSRCVVQLSAAFAYYSLELPDKSFILFKTGKPALFRSLIFGH